MQTLSYLAPQTSPATKIVSEPPNLKNLSLCLLPGTLPSACLGPLQFWPVPLGRVAHDETHNAPRQHDLEIVTVLHQGHDQG